MLQETLLFLWPRFLTAPPKNADNVGNMVGVEGTQKTGVFMQVIRRAVLGIFFSWTVWAQTVSGVDPHVHAVITASPPSIQLRWEALENAASITISRRVPPNRDWVTLGNLAATATSYVDTHLTPGTLLEYRIQKTPSLYATGVAYVMAGMEVPFVEQPGRVLILVDNVNRVALASQLSRLAEDMENEGWRVQVEGVEATASPVAVKEVIRGVWGNGTANLKAVFLIGAVPRPYSGCISPDGHADHLQAWPADGYYADMEGSWTDTQSLCTCNTCKPNRAGDGAFDQSTLPNRLTLQVGRLDAREMTRFAPLTETELLARYFERNHNYRTGITRIAARGLVRDNFGYFSGEAFARVGWRDNYAIFGTAPTVAADAAAYFEALESPEGYAFAFAIGPGSYESAGGGPRTADFVTRTPKAVFMGLFGSYFGDWGAPNNLMRAALLSPGTGLASMWTARPYVHLHGLGALKTFGEVFIESVNAQFDGAYDTGSSSQSIHQALLGDPTLRLFVTRPVSHLRATATAQGILLSWDASPDADGYHVYLGPTTRLTASPIPQTSYLVSENDAHYRVVAVQKQTTGSGTFFQHSPAVALFVHLGELSEPPPGAPSIDMPAAQAVLTPGHVGFGGKCQPFASVVLSEGLLGEICTVECSAGGEFECMSTLSLGEGNYEVVAWQTDSYHRSSPLSPPLPFVVEQSGVEEGGVEGGGVEGGGVEGGGVEEGGVEEGPTPLSQPMGPLHGSCSSAASGGVLPGWALLLLGWLTRRRKQKPLK